MIEEKNLNENAVNMQCKYVAMNCGRDCANCWKFELIKPHWIPCSERMPAEGNDYLVTVNNNYFGGETNVVKMIYDESQWWYLNDEQGFVYWFTDDVIAWMPLPEPYKEGEE